MDAAKQVVVIASDLPNEPQYFDTIKEAQDYIEERASDYHTSEQELTVQLYTLFAVGKPTYSFNWNMAGEPITSLIDNKKTEMKKAKKGDDGLRRGKWTELEVKTLLDNREKGIPVSKIAEGLKRPATAVHQKLIALNKPKKKNLAKRKENLKKAGKVLDDWK